jgi:hypothetical protein
MKKKTYDFAEEKKPSLPALKAFDSKAAVKTLELLFTKEIEKMKVVADKFMVKDQETVDIAIDMMNQTKKMSNRVEKEKKVIKAKYLAFNTAVDSMVRAIKNPLDAIKAVLAEKVKPIALALKLAEDKRLRKAAEEKARIEKANQAKAVKVPVVPIAPTTVASGTFKTAEGSATVKVFKKWTIVDMAAVPRKYKYWAVDQDALDRDVQNGVVVPGLQVTDDIDLKTRVNKS